MERVYQEVVEVDDEVDETRLLQWARRGFCSTGTGGGPGPGGGAAAAAGAAAAGAGTSLTMAGPDLAVKEIIDRRRSAC